MKSVRRRRRGFMILEPWNALYVNFSLPLLTGAGGGGFDLD